LEIGAWCFGTYSIPLETSRNHKSAPAGNSLNEWLCSFADRGCAWLLFSRMDVVHHHWDLQHAHRSAAADRFRNSRSPAPQASGFFMHGDFLYVSRLAGLFQKLNIFL